MQYYSRTTILEDRLMNGADTQTDGGDVPMKQVGQDMYYVGIYLSFLAELDTIL